MLYFFHERISLKSPFNGYKKAKPYCSALQVRVEEQGGRDDGRARARERKSF
jgi:hypothetical protein